MTDEAPQKTLCIVLLTSIIVYAAVIIALAPALFSVIVTRDDAATILMQNVFFFVLLFLIFLLPASYVYWRYRIDVRILGPEPAAAEPGDQITLTIAIGFPSHTSSKGALVEASLGSLSVATQKLESSPTQLTLTVPELQPGYHKIIVRVTKIGCFSGSGSYELLIAPNQVF
jgi:hypothetical protein